MLELQLRRNPNLQPYRHIVREFLDRHMGYDNLKPQLVRVYAEAFDAAELAEINTFYRTPVGRKAVALMPQLMMHGARIGSERVQANIGELRARIEAESRRLAEAGISSPQ